MISARSSAFAYLRGCGQTWAVLSFRLYLTSTRGRGADRAGARERAHSPGGPLPAKPSRGIIRIIYAYSPDRSTRKWISNLRCRVLPSLALPGSSSPSGRARSTRACFPAQEPSVRKYVPPDFLDHVGSTMW